MTAPIEDVSSLPGKNVRDQLNVPIGKVKEIYAMDDGFPMWVAVETKAGPLADRRTTFLPIARLKEEHGKLLVPYTKDHVLNAPEIDDGDGISEEADQKLRGYYGIGTGDQELWSDNKGYAALVPEDGGASQRVEDTDQLKTPDPDRRTDETRGRVQNPGSADPRKTTAADLPIGESDGNDAEGKDGAEDAQEDRDA